MLPARARLRRSSDFAAAVRRGPATVRVGRGTLVLHAQLPSATSGPSGSAALLPVSGAATRAGFVVSRAVGPAVVRNRVRRRLRHLVRDRLGQLPAGTVLVVRANPAAASADGDQLAADLDAALRALRGRLEGGRR